MSLLEITLPKGQESYHGYKYIPIRIKINALLRLLILMILLISPCEMFGQTKRTNFRRTFDWSGESNIPLKINLNVTGFYDKDDNEILDGPFTAAGNRELYGNGVQGALIYNAKGTCKNNVLHGDIEITQSERFTSPYTIIADKTLKASYSYGKPAGTWTLVMYVSGNIPGASGASSGKTTYTLSFHDGKLKSLKRQIEENANVKGYSNKNEIDNVLIHEDNTLTGKWDGTTFKRGINTSICKRKTGVKREIDEELAEVIAKYANGSVGFDAIVDMGFVPCSNDDSNDKISGAIANCLTNDMNLVDASSSCYKGFALSYFDEKLDRVDSFPYFECVPVYMLERVDLLTEEQVVSLINGSDYSKKYLLKLLSTAQEKNCIADKYFSNNIKPRVLSILENRIKEKEKLEYIEIPLANEINKLIESYPEYKSTFNKIWADRGSDSLSLKKTQQYVSSVNRYLSLNREINSLYSNLNSALQEEYSPIISQYKKLNEFEAKDISKLNEYTNKIEKDFIICNKANDLIGKINTHSSVIKSIKDDLELVKMYSEYEDKQLALIASNGLMNSIDKMEVLVKEQEICLSFRSEVKNIKNKMSAVFSAAGDSYGDIVSAYRTYLKKLDLNWFPGADIQKLKDIQKVQDDCLSFIEELKKIESNTNTILTITEDSYKDINKVYQKYLKDLDFTWLPGTDVKKLKDVQLVQEGCLLFVEELKKTESNTDTILSKTKDSYKNIYKVYQKYLKSLDFSWFPGADILKLKDVQKVQETFVSVVNNAQVNDIELQIKNSKDKSINTVLQIMGVR